MKLIKKINNNYALAVDSKDEEIIVSGRGIGFIQMPCEITDLNIITRTYYDIDKRYISFLNEISSDIIEISIQVVDYAKKKLNTQLNPNIIFTLADHINFCIKRYNTGIVFDFPINYDFQQLHIKEIEIARYALTLINDTFNINIPNSESTGIAMNLVNAELFSLNDNAEKDYIELTADITKLIERYFVIEINKCTINYSRFATHLRYLFERVTQQTMISSDNLKIYDSLQKETPDTYECVNRISDYLDKKKKWKLDREEKLYLILHVNRLLTREDCNRKGITSST